MKYTVDMNDRPVYLQIYRLLRADIVGGAFAYGSRLPSKRLLAEELGVSTVTTEHAYDLLCEEGYAQARERSGSGADILHTTPYRSFPTGVTASASKRYEYICWAEKGGRFIVESDYDSEFSVSQKPADTLFALSEQDNVIYLNTFSKTISPSMRVGYMVLPKRLVKTFEERLGFYSCTVPTFEQLVLTELLNSGDFERHINRVRRAKRRELSKT